MARTFRSLSGGKNFRPWKYWDIGDYVIGKLIRKDIDQYKKDCWVIEVEEVFFNDQDAEEKFGPGKTVGLNSCGGLDKVMKSGQVHFGDIIRVEYDGMSPMGKGTHEGKDAHSVIIGIEGEGDDSPAGSTEDTEYQAGLSDDDGNDGL